MLLVFFTLYKNLLKFCSFFVSYSIGRKFMSDFFYKVVVLRQQEFKTFRDKFGFFYVIFNITLVFLCFIHRSCGEDIFEGFVTEHVVTDLFGWHFRFYNFYHENIRSPLYLRVLVFCHLFCAFGFMYSLFFSFLMFDFSNTVIVDFLNINFKEFLCGFNFLGEDVYLYALLVSVCGICLCELLLFLFYFFLVMWVFKLYLIKIYETGQYGRCSLNYYGRKYVKLKLMEEGLVCRLGFFRFNFGWFNFYDYMLVCVSEIFSYMVDLFRQPVFFHRVSMRWKFLGGFYCVQKRSKRYSVRGYIVFKLKDYFFGFCDDLHKINVWIWKDWEV